MRRARSRAPAPRTPAGRACRRSRVVESRTAAGRWRRSGLTGRGTRGRSAQGRPPAATTATTPARLAKHANRMIDKATSENHNTSHISHKRVAWPESSKLTLPLST